jgi:hypothetical protein
MSRSVRRNVDAAIVAQPIHRLRAHQNRNIRREPAQPIPMAARTHPTPRHHAPTNRPRGKRPARLPAPLFKMAPRIPPPGRLRRAVALQEDLRRHSRTLQTQSIVQLLSRSRRRGRRSPLSRNSSESTQETQSPRGNRPCASGPPNRSRI